MFKTGIHHVTAMTRHVQANVDFYAGFLGLRLVKQTGGFEDGEQLHLIYGDQLGSPGSLVTFLVWEDGAPGRVGHGQVSELSFAVPKDSIGDWITRAMRAGVPADAPAREFGETVLRLRDPDGIIVKLTGSDLPAAAALPDPIAPRRLHAVTILTGDPQATAEFAARFGYRAGPSEGAVQRMLSQTDALDIRDASGFFPGIPGTGTFDHVALRAPDVAAIRQMRLDLRGADGLTTVHDRKYFISLYARDASGVLFEYATDAPGFTVDEPAESLGQTLMIPPGDAARAEDLNVILPQFALPGEERTIMRNLHFVHRFHHPADPDGSVIVLMHGTGGNESDLMPLAHRINPRATLLGVRGRSTEEGSIRWFRRFDLMHYDQADIRAEAEAFVAFLEDAVRAYGLDSGKITVLGYSNGANLAGAILQLYPQAIRQAVLLRGIQVLDPPPAPASGALGESQILMLSGTRDPYGRLAPALEAALNGAGAQLETRMLETGHNLSQEDLDLARDWMARDLLAQH